MQILEINDQEKLNRDSYDGLIVSVEAGQGDLNLLLAVCDDKNYRDRLTQDYEKEFKKMGIRPYRLTINPQDPSLYDALSRLCRSEDYLQQKGQAILTVMGATDLLPLNLGEARSQLEIFTDYLQYTREGLRDFPFPVVLWLTNAIHDYIAEKAMDFYSWRKGVFFFVAESIPKEDAPIREIAAFEMQPQLTSADIEERGVGMLKVEDLQDLIARKKGKRDESLATLYSSLGNAYKQRLDSGETTNYQEDLQAAIAIYQKVLELQEEWKSDIALATSLNNLAVLYSSQGRYTEAEPLILRSLFIREKQLGENHPDVASSLNNLAALYCSQGRYTEAEPLILRSLSISEKQSGADHPSVAQSLNNLAGLYYEQGRYAEAEPLILRSLSISEKQSGREHPDIANNLNNLALLYNTQDNYAEAQSLSQRALTIFQKTLGDGHPQTQNSLFATKMLNVQALLDCDTQTLYGHLQTFAQKENLPYPDTETNLMLLERIATNPQLLQLLRESL